MRSSIPVRCLALTATAITSPPYSSMSTLLSASSCFTRSGLASGLSTLLIATIIGTRAARTWSMASLVWGMTPSSAATTMIAMSVTCAPRARMAVNASWPGVSRKTMRLPLWSTSLAPMCWVMPPLSPEATFVSRIASSRLVLPWSTWPMTVTIGARVTSLLGSSSVHRVGFPSPSPGPPGATRSCSLAATAASRSATPPSVASNPSSAATSEAVSKSIAWLTVAKMPFLIRTLMISAMLTPSVSAKSLTAIELGSSTGPAGRTGACASSSAAAAAPVRLRCGRGPRRGRYLRGGMWCSLEFERPRRGICAERSLHRGRAALIVAAGRVLADIGSATRRAAGLVAVNGSIGRAHDARHVALRVRLAADRAGPGRDVIRSSLRHRPLPPGPRPLLRARSGLRLRLRSRRRSHFGCRCASRSAWPPAAHSAPPCRWRG